MNERIETALVIGATSDIGRAIARQLAEGGSALQLAGRDPARLEREAKDLSVRFGIGYCFSVESVFAAGFGRFR